MRSNNNRIVRLQQPLDQNHRRRRDMAQEGETRDMYAKDHRALEILQNQKTDHEVDGSHKTDRLEF